MPLDQNRVLHLFQSGPLVATPDKYQTASGTAHHYFDCRSMAFNLVGKIEFTCGESAHSRTSNADVFNQDITLIPFSMTGVGSAAS